MYKLDFELPGLPPTTNGAHGSWQVAAAKRKKWRRASAMIAKLRRPMAPLERVKLVLTRFSSSRPDKDNRIISFKPIVDGLKDGGVILDDSEEVILECEYPWVKVSPKEGKVRIEVTEISKQGGANEPGDLSG